MRTTLATDDDVTAADPQAERNGFPLLPVSNGAAQVTLDIVNDLRDEAP